MKQRHSVQVAGVFVAVFVRLLTGAVRGFSDALRPQKPYALLGTGAEVGAGVGVVRTENSGPPPCSLLLLQRPYGLLDGRSGGGGGKSVRVQVLLPVDAALRAF